MNIVSEERMSQKEVSKALQFLWDGGQVKRYHTRSVLKEQTVAEHTFGVLSILFIICEEVGPALFQAALTHDVAEATTGDVPAHTRRALRENGTSDPLKDLEEVLLRENGVYMPLTHEEERLLKMADVLDGMRYCAQELSMGNRTIRDIYYRYREYARELNPTPIEQRVIRAIEEVANG